MIKIEFPADRLDIARAMARALESISAPRVSQEDGDALRDELEGLSVLEESDVADRSHIEAKVPSSLGGTLDDTPKPPAGSIFEAATLVGDAELAGTVGTDQPATPPEGTLAGASAQLDEKGVAFNPAFCGQAAEPFNKTGKNKGQWKKKKGVDQAAYDEWYVLNCPKTAQAETPINAAAAFGAPTAAQPANVPTDAPTLMVWVSERQAAGDITQGDVNEAYRVTGVNMTDLFGDNPAPGVAAVHTFLSARLP